MKLHHRSSITAYNNNKFCSIAMLLVGAAHQVLLLGAASASATATTTTTLDAADARRQHVVRRHLAIGDFDELNSLFDNAVIRLDQEYQINERVGIANLDLTISNLVCSELVIGDMTISHSRDDGTENDATSSSKNGAMSVSINIMDLDLICDMDYEYTYGFLSGDGSLNLETDNNSAMTLLQFTSDDWDSQPPTESQVAQCVANISITRMDFSGDLLSDILEAVQGLVRNTVERAIGDVACKELGSIGTTLVGSILDLANDQLMPYLAPNDNILLDSEGGAARTGEIDPLYAEQNLQLPATLNAVPFLDPDHDVTQLLLQALDAVDLLLGGATSGSLSDDRMAAARAMTLNKWIRDFVLKDDGDDNNNEDAGIGEGNGKVLTIDAADLPMESPVLFQGHDKFFQTTMTMNAITIRGLDTLNTFAPFQIVGNYTLQNDWSWESLTLALDMTVDIAPSTLEDAILQDFTSTGISERMNIEFGVNNDIDLSAALLLVLDDDQIGALQLGSLLNIDDILPCLLSTIHKVEVATLSINPDMQVQQPVLSGFVSPGMDRILSDTAQAAFAMYEGVLREALPTIFQTSIRNVLNTFLLDTWMTDYATACPTSTSTTTLNRALAQDDDDEFFVDFRDLLLPPTQALELGGSGTGPYGDLIPTVLDYLKEAVLELDDTTGLSELNDVLIRPWTRSQSNMTGTLLYPGELMSGGRRIRVGGLDANIQLRASNARIVNLDTLGAPMEILEPFRDAPHQFNNTATIGIVEDRPVQMAIRLLLAVSEGDSSEDGGIQFFNEVEVTVDLSKVSVMAKAMMMVAESRFLQFPLRDITNLDCWLATIPAPTLTAQGTRAAGIDATAALAKIAASMNQMNLNITCIDCSSPRMLELAELISSPDAQADVTASVNDILNYVTRLAGGDAIQTQIDQLLNDAARRCPHSPTYQEGFTSAVYEPMEASNDDGISYLIMLGGVILGLLIVIAIVVFAVRFIVRRRHKKWLSQMPPHQIRVLARQQTKERKVEADLNAATRSLFTSPEIPRFVRWGMPLVILANIAFFLSGHLSLGATVNIQAEIAGEELKVEKFFEFSIAQSTVDIWNAGGKELAILILIFSGIWPYTKQLMTLALWFAPPTRVSSTKRGSILLWLDWLTKWSMVDVFVMVISIAAFRVSIESPNVSFLPQDFYSIDMMVVPLWGLYANMIAQLISQISSHFIIHYHRRVVSRAQQQLHLGTGGRGVLAVSASSLRAGSSLVAMHDDSSKTRSGNTINGGARVMVDGSDDDNSSSNSNTGAAPGTPKQALCKHPFSRPHRGETERLVVRPGVNTLLCAGVVALVILVVIGCVVPSFSLKILGIVGVAVEFGQDFEDANVEHSIFTVVQLLWEQATILGTASDYIGLLSICILFVTTILLVPIAQAIALTRQWFFSATRQKRARMEVFIEILQAWQYAEVYLVAVFVASWQLGPISQYMINAYCESLKDFFAQAVAYGILRPEDAQCFSVQSSIESGFFYLAGGAAILALINTFVTKAVFQYFRDSHNSATLNKQQRLSSADFVSDSGLTNISDSIDEEGGDEPAVADAGFTARIQPVPVLFTDTFRWLLRGGIDPMGLPASSRALFGSPSAGSGGISEPHWDLPEAKAVAYDDEDGSVESMIRGQYVVSDLAASDKKAKQLSSSSSPAASMPGATRHRYPVAATAQRRLSFDDETTASGTTSASGTIGSRQTGRNGNLKDDASYITPPPPPDQGSIQSLQSAPPTTKQGNTTRSVDRSVGGSSLGSMAYSLPTTATPAIHSVDRGQSLRSSARSLAYSIPTTDDEDATRPPSAHDQRSIQSASRGYSTQEDNPSEYAEETVDDDEMFEEYTIDEEETMDEYYYEDENQSRSVV